MFNKLFPDIFVESIFKIPYDDLKSKGIKALVFDIDNTIVPFDIAEPDNKIIDLFEELKKDGFILCILSNNNKRRVELFNKKIGARAVYRAGKPGVKKLSQVLKGFNVESKEAVLIGDQIFTDVWCGNKAGLTTILTKPVSDRDQFVTKVKRGIERQILKFYFKGRKLQ